ncbi:Pyridoxamine 5'-phosphate oxidase [Alteribacillus persepolensis]|uniref:Pyridoxamine 5'-phosphate oxidase n=1 Tax=Alteribacillus persepolensis TaxID=568899 RepID=A0A1G7YAY8_9BACI|nr:pyridoxamine 5'-phosphate oxidase family protein [Alteribacillus persepolensis]SDG93469.1 Pyridoxamine 5'-phosphate oxidase [Alteribacillus persepolensis]
MANTVEPSLSSDLLRLLRRETFVSVATVREETGTPDVHAISWVYAKDAHTIFFSADSRSRIVRNLKVNDGVVISFIANGSTYAIRGRAAVEKEEMPNIPIKLALVKCVIEEVRDVMFYGAKMVSAPAFEKIYDLEAARKLDTQVMDELKRASSG